MSSLDQTFNIREPRVGLVIGTYAAVPYVHLALESRHRHYPHIPVLVNDDCSPRQDALRALCDSYGGDFICNERRLGWAAGDLSSFYNGFVWAQRRGLNLLVKMSRRFIPLYNWLPDFSSLALATQAAIYGNECSQSKMKIRTECIGLNTGMWLNSGAVHKIKMAKDFVNGNFLVEGFIYNLALEVNEYLRKLNPSSEGVDLESTIKRPFEVWSLVPDKRTTPQPAVLWHNVDRVFDYYRVAVLLGLGYSLEEFAEARQSPADVREGVMKKASLNCGC